VSLDIPVQHAAGVLSAVEIGRGTVDLQEVADLGVVRLPAPDHARVVTLGWRKPAPAQTVPPPEPASARVQLQAGTPYFTDLREDHGRSFDLVVANGGLYRVETTGRLHTSGAIGTHFVPQLLAADGNGIGQNMLLQGWLRAGQYRVDLTAKASSGHAGLQASPAPLLTVAPLMPGGTARASLPAGSGLKVPVEITEKGDYRLELLGLNHPFTARLEDSEGWPLAAAGPLETSTQTLLPGQYRLLVMPEPVDTRAVMRLTRVLPPPVLAGHGPHPLPFDLEQRLTWREPAGRNDPRLPDEWRFTLAAAAEVTVRIGDGMQGSLLRPDGAVAAHVVGGVPFHGRLEPGAYRVQATSQGRNDRLDYSIGLTAKELQPAAPRALRLPALVDFALAQDRVVSLTSFGVTPVRAVLRDADGHLLGRYGARDDDWNIALSRLLPAGRYTLELASAAVPRQANVPFNHNDRPGQAQDAQAGQDGQDSAPDDPGQAMQPPGQPEDGDGSPTPYRAQDGAPESEDEGALPRGQTELTLSLPAEAEMAALAGESAQLQGGGVARLALPPPAPGNLIVAGARSSAALVLSLEARDGTGAWRSRAAAEGLAPVLAVPAAGGAWRLSVWQVDGGTLPVTVAARVLAAPAIGGQPRLDPVPLTGVTDDLAVAHVALASRAAMALSGDSAGVLAAAWPDHPAMAAQGGLLVPQGNDLWLIGPRHAAPRLALVPAGTPLTLTLDADARAALPVQNAALTAWVAEAPGQPGLQGGHGMGLAEDSSVALTEAGATATVWNAGADDVLRVNLHPVALRLSDAALPPAALAPASAVVVDLPESALRLHLDLPPGAAAVAGWPEPGAVTAWAGRGAISRTIEGSWHRLLLVNTGAAPAPVTLGWDRVDQPAALTPDAAVKRFFGAAGSLDLRVAAQAGQTLNVAGATDATFLGDNGAVARGPRLRLAGPGRLVVTHGPGLVAAWLEGAGAHPWPMPAPVAAVLPSTIALAGTAMRLALAPAAPALVRLRSTAPLILAVNDAAPMLFAAGVAESFYLPAGGASLTLISPQDGPLTGSLALTASPVLKAVEGLGAAVTVAPGDSVAFGFALTAPARIGVGVRAQPDQAELRLLDAHGSTLATGAAMLRDLPAGDYVLQARVPQDGTTTIIRPALVGLVPRPNGPPPETIAYYRALAGLTSAAPGERAP